MEQHGNKTIMCSVFFLDIVEYSKKSVSGQIALRERFNAFLSKAIQGVPLNDRIILDTGDGAAISFLGDVEDALQAALAMRECLVNEGAKLEPPLMVRMGINLGPVRLVRDINGQPNIVGDGINVAQRVMSFADADQLLVSRSYFDAVSRLSPEYAGMFHYQGARTDKHVRDHEVYAIGYPGEFTVTQERLRNDSQPSVGNNPDTLAGQSGYRQTFMQRLHAYSLSAMSAFRDAPPARQFAYSGILAIAAIVMVLLLVKLTGQDSTTTHKTAETPSTQSNTAQPASEVVAATTVNHAVTTEKKLNGEGRKPSPAAKKPAATGSKPDTTANKTDLTKKPDTADRKTDAIISKPEMTGSKPDATASKPDAADNKPAAVHKEPVVIRKPTQESAQKEAPPAKASVEQESKAFISVRCAEGSEIYLDGHPKGKIGAASSLVIEVEPGKHQITIARPLKSMVETEYASVKSGETVKVVPSLSDFCK